jgi:hypothetical protein
MPSPDNRLMLVRNNTLINPLHGLAGGKRLDFSGRLPAVEINDLMRKPHYGIVTISSGSVRGSGNRAENAPPAWRGMIGIGAWSANIHIDEPCRAPVPMADCR